MKFYSLKEKLIFYDIPVFLFSLIPLFLITGPFLSDLSVSLISILFLIYCLKRKNFSYFKHNYFYFFLIFWLYLLFNSIINNFNYDSLKISLFYFRYGVFVIAIVSLLEFDQKFIKFFFACIFICFTVLIIDGFYEYFFIENDYRVICFFGSEKILGSYLSRIWPIFFGISIFVFKKKNKLFFLFILIFILSEALIFLSGDRTAFFFINLSAIFVILFSKKLLKLRLFTLLSSILILIIVNFINSSASDRVFSQTLKEMNLINKDKNLKDDQIFIFSKGHNAYYISAYKMYLENKIFGVGIKNFRTKCKDKRYYAFGEEFCNTHPHNYYLQILSETGIIGFIFLLTCLIFYCSYIIRHTILKFQKKYYFNDFEICILSGIAIYLWPFIPTGNVFNNWLNIALILNLPFLIWSKRTNKTII